MDPIRRNIIATGAAATVVAAAPSVFAAQTQTAQSPSETSFFDKGQVRTHYEDQGGTGFPLLCIPGGGLNSVLASLHNGPFDPFKEFAGDNFRCISQDLRNAPRGQSSGPLEVDRPWDTHTDDQLDLMDHLGINKFMVIGFCAGGPMAWNLIKRAPDRVVAIVEAQPAGFRPEMPTLTYDQHMKDWGPALVKRWPDITMDMVQSYLTNMYKNSPSPDFLWTVTRDFVRQSQTPILILPDDIPGHPLKVAMETAMLSPNAEVSMYPWKDPKERIPIAVRQVRSFLKAHRPA